MNMNQLAKLVCELEGKKKSVDIAQVKEILKILSRIVVRDPRVIIALLSNGLKAPRVGTCLKK